MRLGQNFGLCYVKPYYAGLIWQALSREREGRAVLQALAAQLARLVIDCREWEGLLSPGALSS